MQNSVYGRCRLLKTWKGWATSIHEEEDQIKRQGYAMNYPFKFEIDREHETAIFSSTTELPYYETTLLHCSCFDFQDRHLPCKHMYRLAAELRYIEIIKRPTFDSEKLRELRNSNLIDLDPEQEKRQEKAMESKCSPVSIDYETGTAIFAGSGKKPYETTVDTCTCRDFAIRKLPCKHIYRLRAELEYKNKSK